MGKLAEAYVDVGANLGPLNAGLARAKSSLKSFALKGGAIALGALGVGGIGAAMMAAAKKASDLGETLSKVGVSFGPAAKGVIDQSDRLAEKFGVVKKESLDAAAAFGLMGQAAGLTKVQSAGLASEMVQLGLDIASFHNLSNAEAFEKLRSGLSGEAEPLRPLGILLSEDAVKAQALAMGLTKVKRELTEQEKVIARMALIKKQAGPAVGDLERTSGSTANQMKKLEGELENAATAFGMGLQDALGDAIKLAHELGAAIKAATGKDVATNVGELARAGVNLGRTAVAGGPGGLASLLGASGDAATAEGFGRLAGDVGLGGVARSAAAAGALKRQGMEAQIAAASGLALESGPTRPDVDRKKAQTAAQQQARQQANVEAARAAAQARNDQLNRNKAAAAFQSRAPLGGVGIFAARPGVNPLLAGGGVVGQGEEGAGPKRAGMLGEEAAERDAERRQKIEHLKSQQQGLKEDIAEHAKRPFQSEQFGSASAFASHAIQKSLSDDDDVPKKQLEKLAEVEKQLQDLNKQTADYVNALKNSRQGGAILRGAS